ncbi:hypothetical protein CcrC1_gp204 [Caulobacter phage C1]|nr:hypothetical protein CcrC1_gp204 [Caulobacter phage C1]UTU08433.1 hypothetical protein CcrC2_gp205 [Caulobacter phage C2]UTU08950.1 hypothetical protein CcrJ4_gp199 [Caulobacter phage J4]UTU09508.1 hypothetical protein CcrBL47_gp222 [Caulobacter phage BL47]UTU10066.1 hypothetical protein CcrRB23_gp204 [Caulobacter phage RB23]WGN97101.1 hypothetical protein [Bertelyvirus sp.]
MKEERDSQRSKLYKAERVLEPMSSRLETVQEMDTFIRKVLQKAPIQARYASEARRSIEVGDGRGRSRTAGGDRDGIAVPRAGRTQWIVLHEVAHTLTMRRYGTHIAAHGWQYAAVYLDLIRFGMGAEAHRTLKESFKAHKVRWTPKRSRPASPETLERLRLMREARKGVTP